MFWLNDEQWSKIEPLLPHYGSPPRVDEQRILSGIVHVLRCGCRWCDCPSEYGPFTTVYNCFNRWSRKGLWQSIHAALTGDWRMHRQLLADSTHIKAHRSAAGAENGGAMYHLQQKITRGHQHGEQGLGEGFSSRSSVKKRIGHRPATMR